MKRALIDVGATNDLSLFIRLFTRRSLRSRTTPHKSLTETTTPEHRSAQMRPVDETTIYFNYLLLIEVEIVNRPSNRFIILRGIHLHMGLFDGKSEDDIILENADLDCVPQNEFVSKEQIEKIDPYLDPGEKVHFLAKDNGGQLKIDGEKQDMVINVLTAVTDRRILVKQRKMIGSGQTSIDYKDIASVEVSFGMVQKRLNLETDSKVFGMGVGAISKDEVQDTARFIREKARESNRNEQSESATSNSSTGDEDPLDKLERLGQLRDNGVITEQEFQEKKQSLLDQI